MTSFPNARKPFCSGGLPLRAGLAKAREFARILRERGGPAACYLARLRGDGTFFLTAHRPDDPSFLWGPSQGRTRYLVVTPEGVAGGDWRLRLRAWWEAGRRPWDRERR